MNRLFTAAALISLSLCVMFAVTAHLYLQNNPYTDAPIMRCALLAALFATVPLAWALLWRDRRKQSRSMKK